MIRGVFLYLCSIELHVVCIFIACFVIFMEMLSYSIHVYVLIQGMRTVVLEYVL